MAHELVLFDLDNTLLDRDAAFKVWATEFVRENQLAPDSLATIIRIDVDGSTPRRILFEETKELFGIASEVEVLLARYYVEYPACYTVSDDVVRALRRLHSRGYKLGVVTNGPPSQLRKLEVTNLIDEFDAVCISEVVGVRKPDAAIFEEAARRCSLPLSGWMIGDSQIADIAGGHAVGLRTIWMTRGRTWESSVPRPDGMALTIPDAVDIVISHSQSTA